MDWIVDPVAPSQLRKEILQVHERSGRIFLRREGGNDLFESRVAAQCVPHWIEFEVAVGCAIPGTTRDWIMCSGCELLDSRIFIASVNGDSRSKIGQPAYIECIDLHLINNC